MNIDILYKSAPIAIGANDDEQSKYAGNKIYNKTQLIFRRMAI